jgi:RNA polymerase sigma-70 factor (ECF subfamily)
MAPPRDPHDLRDPAAFAHWYRRLAPSAVAAAGAVLRDPAGAEDVVQDVFAALWSKPEAFRPERGSLGTLVHVMARSRSIDRVRSRAAAETALERAGAESRVHPEVESPAEAATRRETARELLAALERQPPAQRAAVLLHHVAGLTDRELATATGVPLGTAKSRIRLGTARVATQLAA